MTGEKATAVAALCDRLGAASLRLDYSGHGASGGDFECGTISRWAEDAAVLIDRFAPGPLVLVGSSMGGWIALLLARRYGARVHGLVGIAAAPDFTADLPESVREAARRDGAWRMASPYGGETVLTRPLIEDGERNRVLTAPLDIACPVRLLHGQHDADVPWQTALRIADRVAARDVRVILVKDGEHRLSRPADIALLEATLAGLLSQPVPPPE